MTKKLTYLPAVLAVLLALATAMMGSFDLMTQKWAAWIGLIAILVLTIMPRFKNTFKAYTAPLFIVVIGYVIWNGVSIFYADVPKAALFEFTKLVGAAAVFLAVLALTSPTKKGVKTIWFILSAVTAFFGILSIDAASNGPLASAFKAFMGLFTNSLEYWGVFENGIRITGIFGNANTFAGFMVLGVLLSLALVIHSESKKEKTGALVLLAVNALSYILLFSMGSLFMFFLACILMIAASQKGERLSLFILMAETAVITLIFTGVSLISLGTSPWIPLLALVLSSAVLWAADNFIRQPAADRLASHTKTGMITGIVLIVLLLGYTLAALNITGPLTLSQNETIMRASYLEAGSYKLSAAAHSGGTDSGSVPTVRIVAQNHTDLKVHSSTELFNGPLSDAAFTVPKDSEIVKLYFTGGTEGSTIEKVTYGPGDGATAGTETGSVKLDYKLLPAIIANRIQDLGANENSVQRMVFFEDGLKLFKQSPIIGHGLSGYEEGVASVQNFFYETRYVHNHYIQALCDLGIIGFALFISMLVLSVMSLIKMFRASRLAEYKNSNAFALPVMAACIFQMFGQAVTDLTWSAGPFLLIAFAIMALLIVVDSESFKRAASADLDGSSGLMGGTVGAQEAAAVSGGRPAFTGDKISRAGIIAVTLVMTILLSLNLYAHYKASTGNCTMDQIAGLTKIDKFESDDYKVTYIVTASTYGLQQNFDQANKYAKELTNNPDAILNYLLPYYFNTGQDELLFQTASIAVKEGKANPAMWNQLFHVFDEAIDMNREDPVPVILHLFKDKEYYIEGLIGYYKDLQKRNAAYLDDATLDARNITFIGKLLGIEPLGNKDLMQAIDVFSKTLFDSAYSVDANNDQIPDNISVLSGSTVWGQTATGEASSAKGKKAPLGSGFDGSMTAAAGTSMELQAYCVKGGEYTVRLAGMTGLDGSAAPRNLTAFVDGQPAAVQYDGEGAFVKVNLKGATAEDKAKNVEAVPASTEKIQINFPTGAQMGKVTLKK
ncbi:O-antigen ligase family protein [Aminipila luticellarii]|uniref:O-antigen ligase-related domain-containing protein n=1 Tax=Aminipila luticellarii TaxID=2507160 RepID=A0A410PSG5_9FIRM|nr:O-antigen ligase family protein [Aminipila luticellarii]QAT41927.1 hypothetical protein EQM06_01065 [Aminipila luticellarii]